MKEHYIKPELSVVDGFVEGVYAASGNAAAGNADSDTASEVQQVSKNYSITETNAWEGNKQYNITFTNTKNKKVDSVTVTLQVSGKVTSIGGNVTGTVNGTTATVTFDNYGNGIEANTTTGPIYMSVQGSGTFSLS